MNESKKLIINGQQHNCSHCGTKSANYYDIKVVRLHETKDKTLHALFITCKVCGKISMHLVKGLGNDLRDFSIKENEEQNYFGCHGYFYLQNDKLNTLDDNIIMSIPTPTFIIDANIPKELRDLLVEALECVKANSMTGASACVRKAIYTFLAKEKAEGTNYGEKIKAIKGNWANLTDYLDVLGGIKGVTSDQCHEGSCENFNSGEVQGYVRILEEIFREVYVIPQQRTEKKNAIMNRFNEAKKVKQPIKG